MNENSHLKHVFWLTIATIFISTSGALGKFIAMPPPVIVWWRSALAAFFLLLFCFYKKIDLNIHRRTHFWTFVLSALFMGAHWITYFYALKLSNVAIGMLSLFTFPVITAILEPLFSKVKFDVVHVFLGLLVLLGIYLLIPNFSLESKQLAGVLLGLISAVCYSLRTLILKKHIGAYNSTYANVLSSTNFVCGSFSCFIFYGYFRYKNANPLCNFISFTHYGYRTYHVCKQSKIF